MATVNWDSGYKKTLTISSGQTASADTLDLAGLGARRKFSISFIAPATLPETVTVEINHQTGGTFQEIQSGGSDVTLTASKVTVITDVQGRELRLVAGSAVAADRTFELVGNVE